MSRRRRCEHCGTVYTPARPERRYCSRACAHAARPRAARVQAGRKGGRISGERKRRQAEQRRTIHLGNVRQEAYRLGYGAGYEKGYEDAVQRMLSVQERRTA